MEELSIEEKAKRYDEAIVKGRQIQNTPYTAHWDTMKEVVEHLFPELKENKDEVIRKALVELVRKHCVNETRCMMEEWLEKQGKKVNIQTINEVWKDMRLEVGAQASGNRHEPQYSDNSTKLFSLNDIDEIIEKISEKQDEQKPAEISNICEFSIETWVKIVDYVLTEHNGIGNYLTDPEVKDTAEKLQKKYKFDAASEEWDRVYRKGLDAGVNKGRAEALKEQKPLSAWSEEDSKTLDRILNDIRQDVILDNDDVSWLKSLKERYTWKPSDEQMRAFYKYLNEGDKTLALGECLLLRQLYNDLKKLK